LSEVREEAIRTSSELLRTVHNEYFWTGEPWVTDQPKGEGNTVLSLTFSAAVERPGVVIDVILQKKPDDEPDLGTKH
jgi:hypothetical protein